MKTGTKGARRRGNKLHNNCNCHYCTGTTKEELLKLKHQSVEGQIKEGVQEHDSKYSFDNY